MDVDWRRFGGFVQPSGGLLDRIVRRLRGCPHISGGVWVRVSAGGNGFHVQFMCDLDGCDVCRLVFDSPKRFDADCLRPECTRDVLWDSKVYWKGGRGLRLYAGDWEEV